MLLVMFSFYKFQLVLSVFWKLICYLIVALYIKYIWQAPRRNCCRVMKSNKKGRMVINVGICKDGEVSEP